ncbi:hypothetical protein Rrhod_4266 [Rhodococcus rhodnii LMG 5362]|uniref:Tyr recombinase domain-containing protein n=1 Tax=Rhodococcus rhodnii LMG 5362 TaxID=1273125 RepID=R7WKD2_9NOCA|nr:hypothetical protein Rrhod_4266 [Rhodococcus rhodnii LMG 5362]
MTPSSGNDTTSGPRKWPVGQVESVGLDRIRLHDARHTCGTMMHMQAVPIVVVAAWLGHSDPAFTMRTYVHSQNEALTTTAASVQRVVTIRDNP